MNSRERLVAAARGGPVDRAPWFAWSAPASLEQVRAFGRRWQPDAVVTAELGDLENLLAEFGEDGPAVLFAIRNPYGLATAAHDVLDQNIFEDPDEAESLLNRLRERVAALVDEAISYDCDGIFYCLEGATPQKATPMQYGGFYLEKDQELLESVGDARFNVLHVEGGDGVYIDFVHDLPAHALSWDEEASGLTPERVRKFHVGALACGLHGDHRRLWEEFNGTGLIFAGRVPSLREYDFSKVKSACEHLGSLVVNE